MIQRPSKLAPAGSENQETAQELSKWLKQHDEVAPVDMAGYGKRVGEIITRALAKGRARRISNKRR
jgi:hypothetical protein